MRWDKLLNSERLCDANYKPDQSRSIFVQDYDRIVFSAPFRRLANKTQVQPLYENDHVHHRLIHSLEVSSVGRSLAMRIGNWLEEIKEIETGQANDLANIVQAACAAHDIGNPPFGHSGESAIGEWFAEQFDKPRPLASELDDNLRQEFINFEGNAQGFRILTRLEMYNNEGGMRLSKAMLGAFTKYPTTARTSAALYDRKSVSYVGLKKFGIFQSEYGLFEDVAKTLELPGSQHQSGKWWKRHPLVFVVEAADDICYNIVDLEDAFATGELSFDSVQSLLHKASGSTNRETSHLNKTEHIALLRALSIGKAIESCVDAFKTHYSGIMDGTFSGSLTEASSMKTIFEEMGNISKEQVFTARRKTELEITGRQSIRNVMTGILPVFEELSQQKWNSENLSGHNKKIIRALGIDTRNIQSSYDALHALADFTSGMTDRFCVRASQILNTNVG